MRVGSLVAVSEGWRKVADCFVHECCVCERIVVYVVIVVVVEERWKKGGGGGTRARPLISAGWIKVR